jgi:hypothetical protein
MIESHPFATLQQITAGYIVSRCLHVVADLGVADVLDETPRTAAELAALLDVHPGALGRVMALLSAHGVFEARHDRFCHSPASRLLLSDHPQSMRAFVQMFGLPVYWTVYGDMAYSVRTGTPALEKVVPEGWWAYLAQHPEESDIFSAAMANKSHAQVAGVIAAYDFSGFELVGDIGGGLGHLLQAIIASTPTTQGILFDLPHVIEQANAVSSARLRLQAGDFFSDALPACDAYVLMEIIHDWGGEAAAAILEAVRRAAPPDAKLLLIETLVPDDPGPDWSKVLDIAMMAMLGGSQRTRRQYQALFNKTGFDFCQEIDTGAGISIIEAVAVS